MVRVGVKVCVGIPGVIVKVCVELLVSDGVSVEVDVNEGVNVLVDVNVCV